MILVDTRSTFLDTEGKPLSAGRLLFYKADNTTELVGYADEAFTTPIGTSVRLMDAGWLAHEVYFTETACVHVQKFVGVDAQNNDLFSDEKVITVPPSVTAGGTSSGSYLEVDSIAELQEVIPSDGMLVFVKGYYEKGDAPIRAAYFDINSFVQSNSGTVIESNKAPHGRWIIPIEGPYVDSRIFGVIPRSEVINNSYLANAASYCNTNKKTLYIPSGTYKLLNGGSLSIFCALKADSNVFIESENGEYSLSLYNKNSQISNTFASTGVHLYLQGNGWEQTIVPSTAWDTTLKGYCEGTAHYILKITTEDPLTFNYGYLYNYITVDSGLVVPVTIANGIEINAKSIEGLGKIHYNTSTCFYLEELTTSKIDNMQGYAMMRTSKKIIVDSDCTMPPGVNISTPIFDAGGHITNGPITQGGMYTTISGAINVGLGFFKGDTGFNIIGQNIRTEWFETANLVIKTWNNSPESVGELNLNNITATVTLTKNNSIVRNGYLRSITCANAKLYNVNTSYSLNVTNLVANGCEFIGTFTTTSCKMTDCYISNSNVVQLAGSILSDVTFTGNVRVTGGSGVWRNVNLNYAYLTPSGDNNIAFGNFDWVGGAAKGIYLDAGYATSTGAFTMYNVVIKHIKNLEDNVNTINSLNRYWAETGHYNVLIGENERGRATYGSKVIDITYTNDDMYRDSSYDKYIGYISDILFLNQACKIHWTANAQTKDQILDFYYHTVTTGYPDGKKNGEVYMFIKTYDGGSMPNVALVQWFGYK